jgi:hypothetical protein
LLGVIQFPPASGPIPVIMTFERLGTGAASTTGIATKTKKNNHDKIKNFFMIVILLVFSCFRNFIFKNLSKIKDFKYKNWNIIQLTLCYTKI